MLGRIFGLWILATLHVFSFTPKARAFIFLSAGTYNTGARPVAAAPFWTGRSVTFRINTDLEAYGGVGTPSISSAQLVTTFRQAVDAWKFACESDITIAIGADTTSVEDSSDNINTVSFDNRTAAEGNTYANTGVLGYATSQITSSDQSYTDCDIRINGKASVAFGFNGEPNKADLLSVLVHEIGHCLGLDHSVSSPTWTSDNSALNDATMNAFVYVGDIKSRTINRDDMDAISCIYPKGQSLRQGASCSSYHGTNGGDAISGNINGGPQTTRLQECAIGSVVSVSQSPEKDAGCIGSAFAASTGQNPNRSPRPDLLLLFSCVGIWFVIFKVRSRLRRREER